MTEVDAVARPADAVVSAWFRTRRDIGDKDRGHISDLLYALMRHHARLGWWLDYASSAIEGPTLVTGFVLRSEFREASRRG